MSYSFFVRKATREEAVTAVAQELEKVVASQPIHAADRWQAFETAVKAIYAVLPESNDKDVFVSMSGSVSWEGTYPESFSITGVTINVYASLVRRESVEGKSEVNVGTPAAA